MAVAGRTLGVAVVGCGLVGRRRAVAAAADERTAVRAVVDIEAERAAELASELSATAWPEWEPVVAAADVDVVVVATPNALLARIAITALEAGRHVIMEKPMGRNLAEAERLAAAAERSDGVLKIGFNHRYHPGVAALLEAVGSGEVGRVLHILARYGHGGRPGLETEWRANPELAGGGHLLDQGVHVVDLVHAVAGLPAEAVAFTGTAVWPIEPLEDHAFGMFRYPDGVIAQIGTRLTEWHNRFSFEVVGERGAVAVEGLGGSYGTERLIRTTRDPAGGPPRVDERAFPEPDVSWQAEWDDFVGAIVEERPVRHGGWRDGLAAMRMVDALYRSAAKRRVVEIR